MTLSVSILMPSMPSPNYVQTSKVKVRHLYTALNANELSISPGHILEILEKEEGGWWLCKDPQTDAIGWVPSTYVEVIMREV